MDILGVHCSHQSSVQMPALYKLNTAIPQPLSQSVSIDSLLASSLHVNQANKFTSQLSSHDIAHQVYAVTQWKHSNIPSHTSQATSGAELSSSNKDNIRCAIQIYNAKLCELDAWLEMPLSKVIAQDALSQANAIATKERSHIMDLITVISLKVSHFSKDIPHCTTLKLVLFRLDMGVQSGREC